MNNQAQPRFQVGIDLGTTHTVVAFSPLDDSVVNNQTQISKIFEIDQLVAPGVVARKPLLPSFRYHAMAGELTTEQLVLPWSHQGVSGELPLVVIGELARELGAKVAGRQVVSAKSWLSHLEVDRTAAILPWGSSDEVAKVSPLVASASYLNHVRQCWDHHHQDAPLNQQQVVITVPASFDEAARAFTVEAAALAGLDNIVLLEEPQAVVYHWYEKNRDNAQALLKDIPLLMVCDVGGGTTDLSLISVDINATEHSIALSRIGVGDHLMLGGDNLDLALAHTAERRLGAGNKRMSSAALSQLIQQTRQAKELLLGHQPPEFANVTVLGGGSRLIGGSKTCELTATEVQQLALDGFLPLTDFSQLPDVRQSAIVEFGLPYAADPAISKHLAQFLDQHQLACRKALRMDAADETSAIPSAILLNGGLFNSKLLSERTADVFSNWKQAPVTILENTNPDLAVAFGAVAYAKARAGSQLKIGGGSARSFFLVLDSDEGEGICLLPKGTEENIEVALNEHVFSLTLGKPVRFNLASTTDDQVFNPGQLIKLNAERYINLPPLVAAIKNEQQTKVDVTLVCQLTQVGTLELACVSVNDPSQRWQVEFEIRKAFTQLSSQLTNSQLNDGQTTGTNSQSALPAKFPAAIAAIDTVYGNSNKTTDPKAVKNLKPALEKALGKREDWQTPVLRELVDYLLQGQKRRRRSELHERNWFKQAGFMLRPGFGFALDDWRIEQIWPLYATGLQFNKATPSWAEWWTFWRRAAGGLNAQCQQQIYHDIAPYINPSNLKNRKLVAEVATKSYEDMVRLVASLEHLPLETKIELVQWLLERTKKSANAQANWWAIGRICSRSLFYGSAHNVIAPTQIAAWLPQLLKHDWKKDQFIAFAAVMMVRKCGDRQRDLDDSLTAQVIDKLNKAKAPASWIEMVREVKILNESETKRVYGDALPAGLILQSN